MLVLAVSVLALGLALAVLAYAMLGEPYRPIFKRHDLDVPAAWPTLSVLHISDLHVRSGDLRLYRAQRAALSRLPAQPDLVCVTGDICEEVEDIHLVIELLRTVRPRLGTFVVLGNHEHNAPLPSTLQVQHAHGWRRVLGWGMSHLAARQKSDGPHEGHAMADALTAAGITVLDNAGRRVFADGQSVWIAGSDSAWAGHADLLAAMVGRLPGEPCLALIHEPDLAFQASALGADLILAGHTHGGQVQLPFLGTPYTLRMDARIDVAAGFQAIGDGLLHITAGLGHTIPLRFGVPPEVVWLDCVAPTPEPQASLVAPHRDRALAAA